MINVRPLAMKDQEIMIHVWNQVFPKDKITVEKFIQMAVCDDNYDSQMSLIAEEDGEFLGYALGIYRHVPYGEKGMQEGTGWIPVIFVNPLYRRKGIGMVLYKELEKRMLEAGIKTFVLATYSPFYFFPGVDEEWHGARGFFENAGYCFGETMKHFSMEHELRDYQVPYEIKVKKVKMIQEGYEFRRFRIEDFLSMKGFMEDNFNVGWKRHVMDAVRRGTAENTIWICLFNGRIAGYVQRAMDGDPERYGPFGVGEDFRNRGLGSVLLHEMLWDMKNQSLKRAFFKSTEENGRRLYERYGFNVNRIFYESYKVI